MMFHKKAKNFKKEMFATKTKKKTNKNKIK